MSTIFNLMRDVTGSAAYAPAFAIDCFRTTLAAGVEQHFTVPGNYQTWVGVFAYDPGLRIFVARASSGNTITATVPGGSFVSSNLGELLPQAKFLYAGDYLSFITPDITAYVTVSLYAFS